MHSWWNSCPSQWEDSCYVEARETKIIDFNKWEYLTKHIILSTTSIGLGIKIKNLKSAKEIWEKVKEDATTKSTLFLIEAEDQLTNMRLQDLDDPKTHLTELKQ